MNGMAINGMSRTALWGELYSLTMHVSNYDPLLKLDDFKRSGPAWERWFDVFRRPAQIKKSAHHGMRTRLRRDPARKCVKDARHWKRRRFVQRLAR